MSKCIECDKELTAFEMNLTRKLINRGAVQFYCKKCLAEKLGITEQRIDQMVEQFRLQKCSLFL